MVDSQMCLLPTPPLPALRTERNNYIFALKVDGFGMRFTSLGWDLGGVTLSFSVLVVGLAASTFGSRLGLQLGAVRMDVSFLPTFMASVSNVVILLLIVLTVALRFWSCTT